MDLVEQVDADLDEIRGLLAPMSDEKVPLPITEGKMIVSSDRLRMIQGLDPLNDTTHLNRKDKKEPKKIDDYDKLFRELARDGRAAPTDRTKTDQEMATDQAEMLRTAEEKRQKRMQGIQDSDSDLSDSEKKNKRKRVKKVDRDAIADDLGDDSYRESINSRRNLEEIMPLTYNKDGVLVNNEIFMKPKEDSDSSDAGDSSDSSEDSDSEASEDSDSKASDNEASGSESNSDKEVNHDQTLIGSEEPEFDMIQSDESNSQDKDTDSDQDALEEMYEGQDSEQEEEEIVEKVQKKRNGKCFSRTSFYF